MLYPLLDVAQMPAGVSHELQRFGLNISHPMPFENRSSAMVERQRILPDARTDIAHLHEHERTAIRPFPRAGDLKRLAHLRHAVTKQSVAIVKPCRLKNCIEFKKPIAAFC